MLTSNVFWDVTLRQWVSDSRHFGGLHCLHLRGLAIQEDLSLVDARTVICDLLKCGDPFTQQHSVTSQEDRNPVEVTEGFVCSSGDTG